MFFYSWDKVVKGSTILILILKTGLFNTSLLRVLFPIFFSIIILFNYIYTCSLIVLGIYKSSLLSISYTKVTYIVNSIRGGLLVAISANKISNSS